MKVSKAGLLYLILLIPFLEPGYVTVTSIAPYFSMARKMFFCISVVMIFLTFIQKRDKRSFGFIAIVYAYFGVLGLLTIISPTGDFNSFRNMAIVDISICNLSFLWLRKSYKTFISYLLFYIEVLLIINLLTIVFIPQGLYSVQRYTGYFLGYDNTHIRWMIPGLLLSLLWGYIQEKEGKWRPKLIAVHPRTLVLFAVCVGHVMISFSSTSIVGLAVFAILVFLLNKKDTNKKRKLYSFKYVYYISVIGTAIVVLMANSYMYNLLLAIGAFFGKNMEAVRLKLWRAAWQSIVENPWLGVGVENSLTTMMKMTGSDFQGQSAHNYILNTLYQCGIVGFIFFGNIYRVIGKKVSSIKGSLIGSYFCIFYIVIAVMGLTEPQHGAVCLYTIWALSYFCDLIEEDLSVAKEG